MYLVKLQTKVCEDFTEKSPTGVILVESATMLNRRLIMVIRCEIDMLIAEAKIIRHRQFV